MIFVEEGKKKDIIEKLKRFKAKLLSIIGSISRDQQDFGRKGFMDGYVNRCMYSSGFGRARDASKQRLVLPASLQLTVRVRLLSTRA
jgi:hypothetical protein